jgi:hypothetical protein
MSIYVTQEICDKGCNICLNRQVIPYIQDLVCDKECTCDITGDSVRQNSICVTQKICDKGSNNCLNKIG